MARASVVPPLPEGQPTTKPAEEDAVHFLLRKVQSFRTKSPSTKVDPDQPGACDLHRPQFPELAQDLVFMGGSLSPQTDDPEFVNNPRHEFNFWFDQEAAEIVLRTPWEKIVCTPTDISVKTHMTPAMIKQIEASWDTLARYLHSFTRLDTVANICGTGLPRPRGSTPP